jgi:hypothetical protein
MNFQRSLKSVKAFGLVAATAATMMASTIAPSQAQVPPQRRAITFHNQAGFNSRFFVTGPGLPTFDTGSIPLGQSRTVQYPAGAKVTITLRAEFGKNPVVHQVNNIPLNNNLCFKTFGTIFNPSGGRC